MRLDRELADFFGGHLGVASSGQLAALGITRHERLGLLERGLIEQLHEGVYHQRGAALTLESRCLAICLGEPTAFITGRAGGRLWGLRDMGTIDRIEVRVPHFSHALKEEGILLRRCNQLDERDIVQRRDGIRVASPPRLVFDLAADLDDLSLESVTEQILDRGWSTHGTIVDVGRRLYHPARPGSARWARVISRRPAWLRPADSRHEVVLFAALRDAGVSGLARQQKLDLPGGWTIHGDVAVPDLRWMIPIDHVTWHGGRIDAQRDKQNDRQARMLDWQIDRVTDDDLDERLAATVEELLAIHQRLVKNQAGQSA